MTKTPETDNSDAFLTQLIENTPDGVIIILVQ